jgi:hypothetical protein
MSVVQAMLGATRQVVQGMFRRRDPQNLMFETVHLLPEEKRVRLEKSWAHAYREQALPLVKEEPFAPLYDAANGRPNAPVQVVLSVLLLKELHGLTDMEALEQLEFSLLWQHALRLSPEQAHLCQKTLHNFRVKLIEHGAARLAFEEITAGIVKALGIRLDRQRLDSTHILSNFALLTRLGLFCETLRVGLAALRRAHPRLFGRLPEELRSRYLKDDGTETRYRDAKSDEAKRRLDVCARDVYCVLELCNGKSAAKLEEIGLLQRLFDDQCEVVEKERKPGASDEDAGQGGAPVIVKEPKTISSDSLQTPHDPDATYSGHKGKGYEVQIAETCHEDNPVEVITHVSVTPSCKSDADATLPVLDDLARRDLQPQELVADTTYGSAANAVEAEMRGTELISPVAGPTQEPRAEDGDLTADDFRIDTSLQSPAICPAGHEAIHQERDPEAPHRVTVTWSASVCDSCPFSRRCPAEASREGTAYVLKADLHKANLERRRRAEARGEFRPRYRIRAGIEGTNSEMKRSHGLGHLRVRMRPRVQMVVYLKALACNLKRMVRALIAEPATAMA